MSVDWEDTFRKWSKPSSDDECEKQERAERMVGEAIRNHDPLKSHGVIVIPQGSYRNNTNVRQESDVDICVCSTDPIFYDYEFADYGNDLSGIKPSDYSYAQFKKDVGDALVKKFGKAGVTRGNKAFDIHENTCRVDADVVPALAYRMYYKKEATTNWQGQVIYTTPYVQPEGTKFISDSGEEIQNWPEQHYTNGVEKNNKTGQRFKFIVRAVKRLKFYLIDKKIAAANDIPSYLIECLLYNVPDDVFKGDSYKANVQGALAHCYHATKTDETCKEWEEVNGIKYLFHATQPWTRAQVNAFVLAAWGHVENN